MNKETTNKNSLKHGGEIFARIFDAFGIKIIYTLSGGHISPILVSSKKHGIKVVDTRHEANAVFAADATARLTGMTGVAIVTAGPGVTNTVTAVENALLAQSPVLVIGGAAPSVLRGKGALQDINQLSIMKRITKWATSIHSVKEIAPKLIRAFKTTQKGVPGPVFVEVPVDIIYPEPLVRNMYGLDKSRKKQTFQERLLYYYLEKKVKKIFKNSNKWFQTEFQPNPPERNKKIDLKYVEKVLNYIQNSNKPILLVSSGALKSPQYAHQLKKAIEKLEIPVYLSSMARGLLGRNNPLQFRHKRSTALKNADLIILAGVSVDFRLNYGLVFNKKARIVTINLSKEELTKNVLPTLKILTDPAMFLIELANKKNFSLEIHEWYRFLKENEEKRQKEIKNFADKETEFLNPVRFCMQLDKMISERSMLIADGGDFVATASYIISPREPLTWLDPGVFGTLGVGGGFALASKVLKAEYETWLLYGDGSAGYSLIEFDTFSRHKLPVIAVIGNNASWEQIERGQIETFQDDVATKLKYSKYQKIAEAFEGKGFEIKEHNEVESIIKEAKKEAREGKPVIINAILSKTEFRKGSMAI